MILTEKQIKTAAKLEKLLHDAMAVSNFPSSYFISKCSAEEEAPLPNAERDQAKNTDPKL